MFFFNVFARQNLLFSFFATLIILLFYDTYEIEIVYSHHPLTIILRQQIHCIVTLSSIGHHLVLIIDLFTKNTNHFHLCPLTAVRQASPVDSHGLSVYWLQLLPHYYITSKSHLDSAKAISKPSPPSCAAAYGKCTRGDNVEDDTTTTTTGTC